MDNCICTNKLLIGNKNLKKKKKNSISGFREVENIKKNCDDIQTTGEEQLVISIMHLS